MSRPGTRPPMLRPVLLGVPLAVSLACGVAPVAVGQSSGPATPAPGVSAPVASPGVSPAPADCVPVAGRLPRSLDDLALHVTITDGVAAIDPDELLDPLLLQLGRARRDVCLVVFRYGDGADELSGQLLRVAGVDAALDLAGAFAASITSQLAAYGAAASAAQETLDGDPVWRVAIVADDQPSEVLVRQLDDTLLLTGDDAAMRRLLPVVRVTPDVPSAPPASAGSGDAGPLPRAPG